MSLHITPFLQPQVSTQSFSETTCEEESDCQSGLLRRTAHTIALTKKILVDEKDLSLCSSGNNRARLKITSPSSLIALTQKIHQEFQKTKPLFAENFESFNIIHETLEKIVLTHSYNQKIKESFSTLIEDRHLLYQTIADHMKIRLGLFYWTSCIIRHATCPIIQDQTILTLESGSSDLKLEGAHHTLIPNFTYDIETIKEQTLSLIENYSPEKFNPIRNFLKQHGYIDEKIDILESLLIFSTNEIPSSTHSYRVITEKKIERIFNKIAKRHENTQSRIQKSQLNVLDFVLNSTFVAPRIVNQLDAYYEVSPYQFKGRLFTGRGRSVDLLNKVSIGSRTPLTATRKITSYLINASIEIQKGLSCIQRHMTLISKCIHKITHANAKASIHNIQIHVRAIKKCSISPKHNDFKFTLKQLNKILQKQPHNAYTSLIDLHDQVENTIESIELEIQIIRHQKLGAKAFKTTLSSRKSPSKYIPSSSLNILSAFSTTILDFSSKN